MGIPLPKLDMDDEQQRREATLITAMASKISRFTTDQSIKYAYARSEFHSKLADELSNRPPRTWIEAFTILDSWYEQNKRHLLREFNRRYIAITDNSVVDDDVDFGAIVERVRKLYGARPVLIRLVSDVPDDPLDHSIGFGSMDIN